VKRQFLRADLKINSVNELACIDISEGLPVIEIGIQSGYAAMQIGGG